MILLFADDRAAARWKSRLTRQGAEVRVAPDARGRATALKVEAAPPWTSQEALGDPNVLSVIEDEPAREARLATARAGERRRVELGAGLAVGGGAPLVVAAGPCAVEDEATLDEAASRLAAAGVRLLRAGAFKPRTSPYSFRGLGRGGLEILGRVARRHGLLAVTEVLSPADVPLVAETADVLQVGARSMQCFPLLEAVGRAGRPVLLKRHPGASYEEWLLACEHVLAAGESRVVLCERGVRTFTPGRRYTLDLGAIVWAREATGLPLAVDPSHAAGCSRFVPAYARAAVAAGCDLLIVETHPDPARARSDAAQALDLETFCELKRQLDGLASLQVAAGKKNGLGLGLGLGLEAASAAEAVR